MKFSLATVLHGSLLAGGAQAFLVPSMRVLTTASKQSSNADMRSLLTMSEGVSSRSEVLENIGAAVVGLAVASGTPSSARAASTADVNKKLFKYDLPPVKNAPDGFSTLLESYGKDQNRDPILVSWNYPRGWIVERPNQDTNFEAGTVSTGNYGKGDSAALFVGPKSLLGGESLGNKETMAVVVKKALSQKGDNQYQNFKLKSIKEGETDFKGNKYYIADFQYELLTGAGFTVERKGLASVTQIGRGIQAVVAATTANRAKSVKPDLENIVSSFRVYEGNFSKYD